MIRTLFIQGDAAERASASFEQGVPVTIVGIDASDGCVRMCTGTVAVLEYSPWGTHFHGRQWCAIMRGES
jgi:hypothetical protein